MNRDGRKYLVDSSVSLICETLLDDADETFVFKSGLDALLVVQLLIYSLFRGMRAGINVDGELEARRQRAHEFDAQTQADESGHGAVGNGGGKEQIACALLVVHIDELRLDHLELLERQGMLGIVDVADHLVNLQGLSAACYEMQTHHPRAVARGERDGKEKNAREKKKKQKKQEKSFSGHPRVDTNDMVARA